MAERRRSKLAIGRLLARPEVGPEAISTFLDQHQFPIVEGAHVTFAALADDVEGVWLRHRIRGLDEDLAMHQVAGTPLWWVTIEVPGESRMEYQFETRRDGQWRRFNDPRNPRIARSPMGDSSVCWSAGYVPPEWAAPDPQAREGSLVEHHIVSRAQRRTNHVTVYLPARYRPSTRYPLLVVHDGADYLEFSAMKTVLDNLIHRLDMAEVIVVFTRPGDRLVEYPNNAAHARWITQELLPWMSEHYPLIDEPSARCLMGSSFGAIAAFSVAHRKPDIFGSLLLQSGSFVFTDIAFDHGGGAAFDPVVKFVNKYRLRPKPVADKMFVSCGVYEPLIVQNRSMLQVWRGTGMEVQYVESRDGHNWDSWRDRLRDGLSWVFPGDQFFFYE